MVTTMTRENKLSIVIAFGLLIFVGMLIADHYSIASNREVAQLGSNVPTPPLKSGGSLIDGPPPPAIELTQTNPSGDRIHIVQEKETLRSLCSAYYGDAGLAHAVALWNNIPDQNNIETGEKIAFPTRNTLIAGSLALPEPSEVDTLVQVEPNVPDFGTYTVVKGDTLSEIAQKVMGTTKKTQLLIDFNTDVMPNPNHIRPGMKLRYPK